MATQVNRSNEKVCLECNRQFTGIVAACPHDGSLLVSVVQDPLIGTTLAGNYDILEVIGHGGMGVVYKARHALMDRVVAIKMLHSNLISDSMSVKRFQQESQSASRIKHPNVITIYDFGISPNGQPFIVMDYLQGESLADLIKSDGQVGVERAIRILTQACDALDHAHKQGVLHRDVKPTNFVLTNYDEERDFVKVVDFGVAKLMNATPEGQRLTQAGEVCGSPVYMSPEQCTGAELDQRSDVYSMGIVVYETLTGKLPILGKTMVDTMSKHISEMPPSFMQARPDLYIPERLEQVVFKALAKDPNDRHQSMGELGQELEMAIPRPGKSQVLRTAPNEQRSSADLAKTMAAVIPMKVWAGVLAAVVVGGIGLIALQRTSTPSAPQAVPVKVPTASVSPTTTQGAPKPAAIVTPAVTPKPAAPPVVTAHPVPGSSSTHLQSTPPRAAVESVRPIRRVVSAPQPARHSTRISIKPASKPVSKTAVWTKLGDDRTYKKKQPI